MPRYDLIQHVLPDAARRVQALVLGQRQVGAVAKNLRRRAQRLVETLLLKSVQRVVVNEVL